MWRDEDVAALLSTAPAELALALMLALWTGQRQGDLLRLPWSAYDGARIRLQQFKTGRRVVIPTGEPLRVTARPNRSPLSFDLDQYPRQAMDIRRIPIVVGQGMRQRQDREINLSRLARLCGRATRSR